jgi:predicted nuclease of predicted toxin-antitoxin system
VKLLFDQNISYRILDKISKDFPVASQVRLLGLTNAKDRDIWDYAKKNGFSIVTFDADFYDIATIQGHPPKIVWLKTGNRTTMHLAEIILDRKSLIEEFLNSSQYEHVACIEIK